MIAAIQRVRHLARRLTRSTAWTADLCDYYGVTAAEAEELGKRRTGRRPSFPGSVSTAAVSGRTFEEIWESKPRRTKAEIFEFYRDIGAWASFRQSYYHRHLDASRFLHGLPDGGSFCEYGGGIGPIIDRIVVHRARESSVLTLVDVPSEHLTFGEWRIRRRIERLGRRHHFEVLRVRTDALPLVSQYDVIAILEVFEHLPDPVEVAEHLLAHLKPGGRLWENFVAHEDAHGADLPQAQSQRDRVYELLRQRCDLVEGTDPHVDDSGTRCWIKRAVGPGLERGPAR